MSSAKRVTIRKSLPLSFLHASSCSDKVMSAFPLMRHVRIRKYCGSAAAASARTSTEITRLSCDLDAMWLVVNACS